MFSRYFPISSESWIIVTSDNYFWLFLLFESHVSFGPWACSSDWWRFELPFWVFLHMPKTFCFSTQLIAIIILLLFVESFSFPVCCVHARKIRCFSRSIHVKPTNILRLMHYFPVCRWSLASLRLPKSDEFEEHQWILKKKTNSIQ